MIHCRDRRPLLRPRPDLQLDGLDLPVPHLHSCAHINECAVSLKPGSGIIKGAYPFRCRVLRWVRARGPRLDGRSVQDFFVNAALGCVLLPWSGKS